MNEKQLALCDSFCYIPQYGPGTASLNVAVAASIVLHSFAVWAGYAERAREGYKFLVDERPQRTQPRGGCQLGAGCVLHRTQASCLDAQTEDTRTSTQQREWLGFMGMSGHEMLATS